MARKPRMLLAGGIYHVTSRGNERRAIFRDDRDRERFLDRLAESAASHQVRIHLYCLMPNHVHLLVETPLGNLDRFMGSVLTGYTVYFNLRHKRSGHLMQGRYAAQVVEGNEYLLKLSRYIHLNPVRVEGLRDQAPGERLRQLQAYPWSSYREYAGEEKPCGWLTTGPLLAMTPRARQANLASAYARYVQAGVANDDREFVDLLHRSGVAIGSDRFVEEMKSLLCRKADERLKKEDVVLRQIRTWKPVEEVEEAVRNTVGEAWVHFKAFQKGRAVRGFAAWALRQYAGLTQREIAHRFGVTTGSAVSHMIRSTWDQPAVKGWRTGLISLWGQPLKVESLPNFQLSRADPNEG